ncbi:hypothetical protein Patl1_09752 [Pistacia atlantica]|uniref:Uncharacterized protein n=1 Tax=Pistacia atlantica TaxID=434234 RepID=A0ACC1A637_9ROSI|nr:hypothetical protein Patl1_09752 [Pistacia atlantica]
MRLKPATDSSAGPAIPPSAGPAIPPSAGPAIPPSAGTAILPSAESEALSTIIFYLDLSPAPRVSESYCDEEHDLSHANVINCTNVSNTWHITQIILRSVPLDGYISAVVKNLTYLEILDLSNNNLYSSIPPELGSLSHLTYLNLANNKLTGSIPPSLGNLKNLTILYLYSNQLAELIPSDLGNLKKVETLDLSYNQLTGPIPERLGNLKMLKTLDFSKNQLTGAIPSHLGRLEKLETLYLFKNFLNDSIPPSFGSLSSLEDMDLSFNRLSGSIPGELGKLVKLETLYLRENELTGSLPKALGKLSNLGILSLSSNYFTGNLPDEYQNIATMKYFYVAGNYLTGPFPKFVIKWVNLSSLKPFCIMDAGKLHRCSLATQCTSSGLNTDAACTGVSLLTFQRRLAGWPDAVSASRKAMGWPYDNGDLGGNNFEDKLPPEIFTMTNLQTLRVTDLNHTGFQLPMSINLTNMDTLVLRSCNIIGQIPSFIFDENTYMSRLDLSFNNFTGVIPNSILNLKSSSSMYVITFLDHHQSISLFSFITRFTDVNWHLWFQVSLRRCDQSDNSPLD